MAKDTYKYFRIEARELLTELGKGVLDLEKGAGTPDLVPRLLRLAHTLKGAARVVKQPEIADQAHAIEDALAPFRESTEAVPRERIDTLLQLLDAIGGHLATLVPASDGVPAAADQPPAEELFRTVRADVAEMDALLAGIAETYAQIAALRRGLAPMQRGRYLADLLAANLVPPRARAGGQPANDSKGDKARSLAEELRMILGALEQGLASSVDQMDRELRQLRDAAEQLRLIPAGALFMSLERTARDAAQTLGKRVDFRGHGSDVRLDAHVLGAVQGALVQLVRNAVAHGVEPPGERQAAGKPAAGRVTLEVARRGRRVAFICKDDGAGVDLEAVRRAAERKGLLPSALEELGAEDLLQLLLRGGISTSAMVTEVSGRGVGLDVVREAAERLSGDVGVRTVAGKGTTLELIVPLSLAAIEALMVESSGIALAIPLDAVRRTMRVAEQAVASIAQGESFVYDGKSIPCVPLARVLNATPVPSRNTHVWSVLVVEAAGRTGAVAVDRVLRTQSIVVRPLPDLVPATPLVAGASLSVEGQPQLVLDPDGLLRETQRAAAPDPLPETAHPLLLVIDDSLTTRMLERSILESAGFEVDVVGSAEEALEEARHKRYALFLVDVEMPGMDGFMFIERARTDPALRDIPAVLVTSRSCAADRRRGQEVGAQAYIVKSEFDQADLLEHIRRLVASPWRRSVSS